MAVIKVAQGPARSAGCNQLYKCAQTRWSSKLLLQMLLYVLFLAVSMGTGGMMPWILQHGLHRTLHSSAHSGIGQRVFREDPGYYYINSNTYSYCRKVLHIGEPLKRGYPAPPLSPKDGQLLDAWHHKHVILKGISWPGFNRPNPGLDGLATGQTAMAATDFTAIVYQLKLLGFNTVKLPFDFQHLKAAAAQQEVPCQHSTRASWTLRATHPAQQLELPDTDDLPAPPIPLMPRNGSCNSYLPNTTGLERLLWTVRYLVANGFYVVLSYQPSPSAIEHEDANAFALAWLSLWTPLTCFDNFSADIRGRILLDLLHQPSRVRGGIGWSSNQGKPGLDQLYLTAMDSIESVTPRDALFLLQGSTTLSHLAAGEAGTSVNSYGLSPGDGFVVDETAITAYQLSDPRPFLDELLQRPFSNRVLLGPHLLGPANSTAVQGNPEELVARMHSSWGALSSEGYCSGLSCIRLPVVAGEIGSRLDTEGARGYYAAVVAYAGLHMGSSELPEDAPLKGWIWSGYGNDTLPGPLVKDSWRGFDWSLLHHLIHGWGLTPWYLSPTAWLRKVHLTQQPDAFAADVAAAAAAAAAAQQQSEGVGGLPVNVTGTLQKLYQRAKSEPDLQDTAVLPALAEATGAVKPLTGDSTTAPPAANATAASSKSSSTAAQRSGDSPTATASPGHGLPSPAPINSPTNAPQPSPKAPGPPPPLAVLPPSSPPPSSPPPPPLGQAPATSPASAPPPAPTPAAAAPVVGPSPAISPRTDVSPVAAGGGDGNHAPSTVSSKDNPGSTDGHTSGGPASSSMPVSSSSSLLSSSSGSGTVSTGQGSSSTTTSAPGPTPAAQNLPQPTTPSPAGGSQQSAATAVPPTAPTPAQTPQLPSPSLGPLPAPPAGPAATAPTAAVPVAATPTAAAPPPSRAVPEPAARPSGPTQPAPVPTAGSGSSGQSLTPAAPGPVLSSASKPQQQELQPPTGQQAGAAVAVGGSDTAAKAPQPDHQRSQPPQQQAGQPPVAPSTTAGQAGAPARLAEQPPATLQPSAAAASATNTQNSTSSSSSTRGGGGGGGSSSSSSSPSGH